MARYTEPTPEQLVLWQEWIESKPPVIRALATRFEPWSLYRLKDTGHRVIVVSFNENMTLTVNVTADYNLLLHERSVFGINPDDLEPCELPDPNEPVGAMLDADEVEEHLDELRVLCDPIYGKWAKMARPGEKTTSP